MHFAAERPEQAAARRPSWRWSWSSASTLDNARAITSQSTRAESGNKYSNSHPPPLLYDRRRDNMSLDEVGRAATQTADAISSENYAICPGVFPVGADSRSRPSAWLARHRGCKARRASPISLPTAHGRTLIVEGLRLHSRIAALSSISRARKGATWPF